jgi:hypothetical protein
VSQPHDPNRIHISADDLADPAVELRMEQMRSAAVPDLVRAVGAPAPGSATQGGAWWQSGVFTNGLAGLAGGILGALLGDIVASPDAETSWLGDDPKVATTVWLACISLGLGTMLAGWVGIESRSAAKFGRNLGVALPFLLGGALIGGFLAQAVYEPMIERLLERAFAASTESEAIQILTDGIHFPRGVAFAVAGLFIGIAVGASKLALKPAINGAIGGAVGGFIGGFLFDYVGEAVESGLMTRVVAISIIGLLIGTATGLVEAVTKQHWLEIVSGGMAGKQFILYQARTTVGAAPSCGVTLIKDPAIAGEHLTLISAGGSLQVSSLSPVHPIAVNGAVVAQHRLVDGDLLQLGSTVLRYRSKAESMPSMAPPAK